MVLALKSALSKYQSWEKRSKDSVIAFISLIVLKIKKLYQKKWNYLAQVIVSELILLLFIITNITIIYY